MEDDALSDESQENNQMEVEGEEEDEFQDEQEEDSGSEQQYQPHGQEDEEEEARSSTTPTIVRIKTGDTSASTSGNGISEPEPEVESSTLSAWNGNPLPYDLSSLTWDKAHKKNKEGVYCYCGKPKTKYGIMLTCKLCKQWFHLECLKLQLSHPPLHGEWSYNFKCGLCTKQNIETFEFLPKNWTDIVRVAIYNLLVKEKQKGSNKTFFQYKEQICAFIDKHWDSLCFGKTRTKTWENTIGSSLSTKSGYFQSGSEVIGAAGYWGLRSEEDPSITRDSGTSKVVHKKEKKPGTSKKTAAPLPNKKKRSSTDAFGDDKNVVKISRKKPVTVPIYYVKEYYNPKRYKYTEICLAKENSAPQIKIYPDKLTAQNGRGYRTVRASFGVSTGSWYYEVKIMPHTGNTRIGWSTERGDVQAPVGFDKYGYSYRDKEGTIFHQSRGRPYGQPYAPGDVIGFYISLPPKPKVDSTEANKTNANDSNPTNAITSVDATAPIPPTQPKKENEESEPLKGSKIMFFKNGVSQSVAFENIFEGTYYPAASMYMGGFLKFNFGPKFDYPPANIEYRPICDVVQETLEKYQQEQILAQQQQEQQQSLDVGTTIPPNAIKPDSTSDNDFHQETHPLSLQPPVQPQPSQVIQPKSEQVV